MIIYALSDNRYSYNTAILSQKKKNQTAAVLKISSANQSKAFA